MRSQSAICYVGLVSPTIFRYRSYRFYFFSREEPRMHVHVLSPDGEAKFWLAPVQLSWNKGYRDNELREIARILDTHETMLLEAWNETE